MQPVLTLANTVTHTRSSPQQPINQGVIGQLIIPQVDPAHAASAPKSIGYLKTVEFASASPIGWSVDRTDPT
jgi:hypothetical protein